jgi:type 2 lantibiotic biosynthesis protein LanM
MASDRAPVLGREGIEAIAAAATSLWERLEDEALRATDGCHDHIVESRVNRWSEVVAPANPDGLRQRLQWDALDLVAARPALAPARWPSGRDLPGWSYTLALIVAATAGTPGGAGEVDPPIGIEPPGPPTDPAVPLPYEEVWLPALAVARRLLWERLGDGLRAGRPAPPVTLASTATRDLERRLLEILVELGGPTLAEEFGRARPGGEVLRAWFLADVPGPRGRSAYLNFVRQITADGLVGLWRRYPVLARLVASSVDAWVRRTEELLVRLATEFESLGDVLGQEPRPGTARVVRALPDLSDPHEGGRTVVALVFEDGRRLVYKPKGLEMEVSFNRLLEWCNQRDGALPFRVVQVRDRRSYGWVEYVEARPCESDAEAARFYRRAGGLVCLLHVLRAIDCHRENLVASGEHPVLVDAEALFQHEASLVVDRAVPEFEAAAIREFEDTVLRTGLLPRWFVSSEGDALDLSALGGWGLDQPSASLQQWVHVNTDDMRLLNRPLAMSPAGNEPFALGEVERAHDHVGSVIEGFQRTYRMLVRERESLRSDRVLSEFRGRRSRFIVRPTWIYWAIRRWALSPEFLRDGVDYSIELDVLSRAFLTVSERPAAWPVLSAEIKAMEELDIPYFTAWCDDSCLSGTGLARPVEGYLREPSFRQAADRLDRLDEDDLCRQSLVIRGAFAARAAGAHGPTIPREGLAVARPVAPGTPAPLTGAELLAEAQTLARVIEQAALFEADGRVAWMGIAPLRNNARYQLYPMGASLYDGCSGVALFLTALDHVTGQSHFRHLALRAVAPLRGWIRGPGASGTRFARQIGLGGGLGLGSVVYALLAMHRFTHDPGLLDDARAAALLISDELVAADHVLDVMGGAAGAILGLLPLLDVTGDPAVRDRALACGLHLLNRSERQAGGAWAWRTVARAPLTGLSHGAAGIAYALLRLWAATGDDRFRAAAVGALTYERTRFRPEAGNWPDLRDEAADAGEDRFGFGWCHGAPGIALARLGALPIFDDGIVRHEIRVGLETTACYPSDGVDHLCCGNMGRIEVQLVAGGRMGAETWATEAQRASAWVVRRAAESGGYRLFPLIRTNFPYPGLFGGLAGIGYQLLRLARPGPLPCVLLWE